MAYHRRTTRLIPRLVIVDPPALAIGLVVLVLMVTGCGRRQERLRHNEPYGRPHPHAPEELSQFDFLIGSWRCEVRVKDEDGTFKSHQATWTARYILDGYVIADEYRETTPDGTLVRFGATYRSYDTKRKTWVMKWLDALHSTWMDLGQPELGGIQVGRETMTFKHRVPPDGLMRCTFSNITEDHFTWLGEYCGDGGDTWNEVMIIQAYRIDPRG